MNCPHCESDQYWDIGMMRKCAECGYRGSILIDCGIWSREYIEQQQEEFEKEAEERDP